MGEDVFNVGGIGGELRITAPDFMAFREIPNILEGEETGFKLVVISQFLGNVTTYSIISGSREGTSIDPSTGIITSVENGKASEDITVRAVHTTTKGYNLVAETTITIEKRVYPVESESFLVGSDTIDKTLTEYKWESNTANITGDYIALLTGNFRRTCISSKDYPFVYSNSSDEQQVYCKKNKNFNGRHPSEHFCRMNKRVNGENVMS